MGTKQEWTYDLRVRGLHPRDVTLEALGEIARRLADVLGAQPHVRFSGVVRGSAAVRVNVVDEGREEVRANLATIRGAVEPSRAVVKLDDYLALNGLSADIRDRVGCVLYRFRGAAARDDVQPTAVVRQATTVVGQVIKIGGRDDTVPMTILLPTGEYADATVHGRDLARKLAQFLFGRDLRFSGPATWTRDRDGAWECKALLVESFEPCDDAPLDQVFERLASAPGSGWKEFDDPIAELSRLRGDE